MGRHGFGIWGFVLLFCVGHAVVTLPSAQAQIEISSRVELQLIGHDPDYPLDGDYVLTRDIDASATETWNSGAGFIPIGTDEDRFTGSFDGQGFVITGLHINRPEENEVGLFGSVGEGATIKDLGLEAVSITGNNRVGGLAGRNNGTVSDVYVTGVVTGGEFFVGGLVGWHFGMLTNSHAAVEVSGNNNIVGGLLGGNGGEVMHCHATGSVSGNQEVGGLVGQSSEIITQCYATGSVSGTNSVGGLVGSSNFSIITQCYAMGSVSGTSSVGGLVGSNFEGMVAQSYATGAVSGDLAVGGLVGSGTDSEVIASFWDTETTGRTSSSGGGTGRVTSALMQEATFTAAGWDFTAGTGDWSIMEGCSYPFLPANRQTPLPGLLDIPGCEVEEEEECDRSFHSADVSRNHQIGLSELLRVIQFSNTGSFSCQDGTEDGYTPGSGGTQDCCTHASDYNPQDWQISLSELLRLIQFFNIGAYNHCPETDAEDGYCAGAG